MKAIAIFPQTREVKLIDHEEPTLPAPHEAKVKIIDVGICGTDRHICSFAFGLPHPDHEYLILGHEAFGQVVEVGAAVTHLKPGDFVVPEVRRPCQDSSCRPCSAQHQDFCATGQYTERGIVKLDGYMTEFVVDDARFLHPVPRELRHIAVLTEPLTIAEKAFAQALHIQRRLPWFKAESTGEEPGKGLTAVVIGAGPIGLLGAMFLVNAGFTTYVYSRATAPDEKATLAESIGAHYVSSQETSVAQLVEQTGGIDLVYEAADAAPVTLEVLRAMNTNAIFVFTSDPDERFPFGIDTATALHHITAKNVAVIGTVNAGPETFTSAIKHLGTFQQRWPGVLEALITRRYPIEQYADILLRKPAGIKQVIAIHPHED